MPNLYNICNVSEKQDGYSPFPTLSKPILATAKQPLKQKEPPPQTKEQWPIISLKKRSAYFTSTLRTTVRPSAVCIRTMLMPRRMVCC